MQFYFQLIQYKAIYKCYTFLFLFFFRKKYIKGKNILKLSFLYSAEGNLKYVSQTLHPSSQNTKKKRGGESFILYIYIYLYKTYGNLSLHRSDLVSNLQWISKKKILRGKYCQQSYTINTDKRRSLCGVSVIRERKQNK